MCARRGGEHMALASHIRHSIGGHGRRYHHNRKKGTNERGTRQQIKMTHPRLRLSLRRVAPQLDLASQLDGLRVRRHLELLAQVWKEKRRDLMISLRRWSYERETLRETLLVRVSDVPNDESNKGAQIKHQINGENEKGSIDLDSARLRHLSHFPRPSDTSLGNGRREKAAAEGHDS